MAQDSGKILPQFLNLDKAYEGLEPVESPFMKGLTWDINANPGSEIGTNNSSGEGQNMFALTPLRSNRSFDISLPSGYNKNLGAFESPVTKELYYFNFNSAGKHGIYNINGDTGVASVVIIDPKLAFTDNQEGFIGLRAIIRYVKDKDGVITEKHLAWTDGKKWQGWINVIAAIGSSGYNEALFPYWKTMPPHFDREELLEWAVRPPMVRPIVTELANTAADLGKVNRIADKAFRFAISFQNTDGRFSTLSPYSLPLTVKSDDFSNDTNNLPKNASLKFVAGSPLTEKVFVYYQQSESTDVLDPTAVWGDWKLYDTIDKFDLPATGNYWLRTNPWASFNYDPIFNTIEYVFDNSKLGQLISPEFAQMIQTGMPQISQAVTDLDDAAILCNNRYNYNNFSKSLIDKLSVAVKEKTVSTCSRSMRTVYLYAYVGQCYPDFSYTSQVGYKVGTDTQVRFGGLRISRDTNSRCNIDVNESKFFNLDFSDREAFRVYLKGTHYYADGEWYIVRSDNSLDPVGDIFDFGNNDVLKQVQQIFEDGSYFVCRFKLTVPAGRYIATIGRHNVSSNEDYKNKSTYIYGIANSRVKSTTVIGDNTLVSIKPNAITPGFSKEMEIDCVNGNVDVWGNNADLFYIYCPYNQSNSNNGKYRFIEGYLKEEQGNPLPVELFPYDMADKNNRPNQDDCGQLTDKNGFYWGYTKASDSSTTDIRFICKLNCGYPTRFKIPTAQSGIGWRKNADSYIASQNSNGTVGACNRIVVNGTVKDIPGLVGYSNIAVSVKDGPTVYSRTDGTFTMILHNGASTIRVSNIYVNAGGNFLITSQNCGQIPLFNFNENLVPCSNCNQRIYPTPYDIRVAIQSLNNIVSLKQGGKYSVGIAGADLAGRIMNVNVVDDVEVSTFLQRGNINATYFQLLINSLFNIAAENPDIKWVAPYVSANVNQKRSVQWVGDSIIYLDNNGNTVNDPSGASFVKIVIGSLYDANIANNFNLLSAYQFVKGDRVRILDNGDGTLFTNSIFGDTVDIQVLGTNYNQVAINAGLLPPQTNTILSNTTETSDVGIILKYDSRLDRVFEKTGFWIELYTPKQTSDVIPFFEVGGFYPVIRGAVSEFAGYNLGVPVYNVLASINIDFWDTYYLQRTIAGKYFNHPFESQNVTDSWGANVTSGGRLNVENKDAAQAWAGGDVIRSDTFRKTGITNGLAMFKTENRKNYGIYPFGEIVFAHTKRNIVTFNCTNDWFTVEYNMPYARMSQNGLVVTNLDENLSLPMKKDGPMYGLEKEDIGTVVIDADFFFWYDRKNTSFVKCNYGSATDVSQQLGDERGGIQSYLNTKTFFINEWNDSHGKNSRFDVVAGIDSERGNVYLTFRPRRAATTELSSFVNNRRMLDLRHQETFVYSIQYKGWLPCANFTPEAYGRLRGNWANVEFVLFASGKPYYHNNTPNDSFLNFFEHQCEPVLSAVLNKGKDTVNILQAISQEINGSKMFADLIYDTQQNSMSYIPANYFDEREKLFYAEVLKNMVSYPSINPDELFRSMLHDGKRMFSNYFVCRMVQKYTDLGKYFQFTGLNYLFTNSHTTKP